MATCENCGSSGEQGADGENGMNWVDDQWVCNKCMASHIASGGSPHHSPAR